MLPKRHPPLFAHYFEVKVGRGHLVLCIHPTRFFATSCLRSIIMTRAATFLKNSQQLAECVHLVVLIISQLRAIEATCIVSGERRQPHKNLGPEHKITAGHWPISGNLSKVTAQNVTRSVLPSEQSIVRVLWVGSRHAYCHGNFGPVEKSVRGTKMSGISVRVDHFFLKLLDPL